MSTHTSLAALENAHDEAMTAARNQIEHAEEQLSYYRSQLARIQESFHELATRHGFSQDPRFLTGFQRVSEECEENVWQVGRMTAELDEDVHTLATRHARNAKTSSRSSIGRGSRPVAAPSTGRLTMSSWRRMTRMRCRKARMVAR